MPPKSGNKAVYSLYLILIASITYLAQQVDRSESSILILSFSTGFFAYFWIVKFEFYRTKELLGLGIIIRLCLFFTLPGLSDDFYRFIWDGLIIHSGHNPYHYLPQEALTLNIDGLSTSLLQNLNSPEYYTIYPPFNQLIFWLAVSIDGSILTSVNFMRVILLLSDVGSFFLLKKLSNDKSVAVWYFLNPLIILELVGNIHFEGIVIFFVLSGLYFFKRNHITFTGIFIGLAASAKLIPLIFLPYFCWKERWKNGIIIATLSILVLLISLLPLLNAISFDAANKSLSLYFQTFEFNASIYYLFREIGFYFKDYNVIQTLGPKLAICSALLIILTAIYGAYKKRPVAEILLFIMLIYLLFSLTVHPWYILILIPLGLLSGYYFPVIWSYLIFITYLGYQETGYDLPMIWVILEYSIVSLVFTFEFNKKINAATIS